MQKVPFTYAHQMWAFPKALKYVLRHDLFILRTAPSRCALSEQSSCLRLPETSLTVQRGWPFEGWVT